MSRVAIVIPCFNEAERLQPDLLLQLLTEPTWKLVFVNDGSTDRTAALLEDVRKQRPAQIDILSLVPNQGKAEAVRRGLLHAMEHGAEIVGYYDADGATPPPDMARIVHALTDPNLQMALGARVALLGRRIDRSSVRHYLGRAFATVASWSLQMRVYDTQCGAKALRVSPQLYGALEHPFLSRWIFDVELMGRLRAGGLGNNAFVEVPLSAWHDVKGSKLRASAMLRSLGELAAVARTTRRPMRRRP